MPWAVITAPWPTLTRPVPSSIRATRPGHGDALQAGETAIGAMLADLTPKGIDRIALRVGDQVAIEGEQKPSELKVSNLTRDKQTVRIEHPKKPHHDGHGGAPADPAVVLKAARSAGREPVGSRGASRSTSSSMAASARPGPRPAASRNGRRRSRLSTAAMEWRSEPADPANRSSGAPRRAPFRCVSPRSARATADFEDDTSQAAKLPKHTLRNQQCMASA